MIDDDLGGPITQEEIDRWVEWGGITCYSCDESIVEAGGAWVQTRPNTAVPYCKECLTPTSKEVASNP